MACPHWQHERCATIGCEKSRWVCDVVKKWIEDKRNAGVVGWANHQVPMVGHAHDKKCACVASKGKYPKSLTNFCSCK